MALVTCHRYLLPSKVSLTVTCNASHHCIFPRNASSHCVMHLLPRCTSTTDTPHPFSNATPHCIFSLHCAMQLCTRGTLHPPPAMNLSRNRWDAHPSVCNKHQRSKGGRITNLKEFNHFRESKESR